MGQKLRHFGALMKKNWIIWKRSLGASICELVCPIALMAILVVARALVSSSNVASSSNISSSVIYKPIDYYAAPDLFSFALQQNLSAQQNKPFFDFSNVTYLTNEAYMTDLPLHCGNFSSNPVRQVIAYAGDASITAGVVNNLKNLCKLLQYY